MPRSLSLEPCVLQVATELLENSFVDRPAGSLALLWDCLLRTLPVSLRTYGITRDSLSLGPSLTPLLTSTTAADRHKFLQATKWRRRFLRSRASYNSPDESKCRV